MREKTLYTAIGRFDRRFDENGIAYPAVFLGGKEYLLDVQEVAVWTCLNWRIVRREEIEDYYNKWIGNTGIPTDRSLDSCVNRLLTRGLLLEGSGETEYDALYDLLSNMYIVPVGTNFFLRLLSACKVMILVRKPLKIGKFLFKSQKCNTTEKAVLRLSKRLPLSTAEMIQCMEMGVHKLWSNGAILDSIYADRDTTSDNIASLVKSADCSKEIITAISNLYLRQQVIFDRA